MALSLKNDVNDVKNLYFFVTLKIAYEKNRIRIRIRIHKSEISDPYQNFMDPQHCLHH
jgi:hypothetical protein